MNNYVYRGTNQPFYPRENNVYNYDLYCCPENLPHALSLIKEAVEDEKADENFYEYLISVAPNDEDKEIIRSIRDDEQRHFELFRRIYYELTCQMLPQPANGGYTHPENYCQGLKQALLGENKAVIKYREILYAMCHRTHINIMTGIITDELRHADLYNLLYSKNECYEQEQGEKEEYDNCKRISK